MSPGAVIIVGPIHVQPIQLTFKAHQQTWYRLVQLIKSYVMWFRRQIIMSRINHPNIIIAQITQSTFYKRQSIA
jgi:hypothetical protein